MDRKQEESQPTEEATEFSGQKPMTMISDSLLVERLRQGDVTSFETLFYRHYDRVYGLLFRLLGNRAEAEDTAQEVFLQLYQQSPQGQREHNISAWLYRVAMNRGYNAIRGRQRRWQRNTILVPDESEQETPPEAAARREEQRQVRASLAQLKPQQAQLLLLRQMGLSYDELAAACDIAPSSVGKLLSRAGKAFKLAYERER